MITPPSLQRREYKCLIDERTVERIRRYIDGICTVDPYATAGGRYMIDTLYLDTPQLDSYWASAEQRGDRYKLRVRGYPTAPDAPTFLEVKRRVGDTILKTRTGVLGDWTKALFDTSHLPTAPKQRAALDNFICHYYKLPMQPTALVRYEREPYFSLIDEYARVTFDRSLSFQRATELTLVPEHERWTYVDYAAAQRSTSPHTSTVLLELKFTSRAPAWMRHMVQTLDLQRLSFCKYTRAIESLNWMPTTRVARGGLFH